MDCEWDPWTPWNGRCLPCVKKESRKRRKMYERKERYIRIFNEYGGKPCETSKGNEIDTEDEEGREVLKRPCQSPDCPAIAAQPYWSNWHEWGPCEESPETPCNKELFSGRRTRKRDCRIGRDGWHNLKILKAEDCRKKHHLDGRTFEDKKCVPPCTSYRK